jgi:hypothetical protein
MRYYVTGHRLFFLRMGTTVPRDLIRPWNNGRPRCECPSLNTRASYGSSFGLDTLTVVLVHLTERAAITCTSFLYGVTMLFCSSLQVGVGSALWENCNLRFYFHFNETCSNFGPVYI